MLKRLVAALLLALAAWSVTLDADQTLRLRLRMRRAVGAGCSAYVDTWTVDTTGLISEGTVIPQGQLPTGCGVQVGSFTTQTDCDTTWTDGSCRHAMVTFNATSTGAKTVVGITNPGGSYTPTWPTSTSLSFAISAGPGNGNTYTATLPSFDSTHCTMNGALARRCWVLVVPKTGGVTDHPTIHVIFEVTSYAAGGHRVGFAFQNIKQTTSMDKMTVTTSAQLAGSAVTTDELGQNLAQSNWTLYTGTRWYRVAKTAGLTIGTLHQDFEPWIDASVIPRIASADPETYTVTCPNVTDLGGGRGWSGSACDYGFWFGQVATHQGDSENTGRDELTPVADWDARYFATGENTYRTVSLTNAKQSGGWTQAIDSGGDGQTILKLTDGSNMTTVSTYTGQYAGLGWQADGTCVYKGVNNGGCSEFWALGGAVDIENEHVPESNFIPYLLTGEKFYLDQLRDEAAWMIGVSYSPGGAGNVTEADPYIWPGFYVGRGTDGSMVPTTFGREFGRPLRVVTRAFWALPDSGYAADKTYFQSILNATLTDIGEYTDYLALKEWDLSPYLAVGIRPIPYVSGNTSWARRRGNTVTSTTAGSSTTLTVVGDDSGVSGVNDHNLQTGDYVDIAGITTSGATALNGTHVGPVTRIDATHFSVPVTTSVSTSGEGTWEFRTGQYAADWRNAISAWEVSWICYSGIYTCADNVWDFPDLVARKFIAFTTGCTNFSSKPGYFYNFYPVMVKVRGDGYSLFANCDAWAAANDPASATAELFEGEADYGAIASHRGSGTWGVLGPTTSPDEYYTPYSIPLLVHARRRGITGAATAYTTTINAGQSANVVLNMLKTRPGFYWDVP
jgi:hypothetical protein